MCKKCYARWSYRQPGHRVGEPGHRVRAPQGPDPADKLAYLSSLSRPELAAYCTGVLSRASVSSGDPDELAAWMDLVRGISAGRAE